MQLAASNLYEYYSTTSIAPDCLMDSHAFASLAHLRILLVPVGSIQQSTFDKFASEIRAFDDIRLGDIPADQKGERGELRIFYTLT